jgi:plastocyanin
MRRLGLIFSLLLLAAPGASGANHWVGIGDDCSFPQLVCFLPSTLTIAAGDSVTFSVYAENYDSSAHNVVADDGSFRCAAGCDGEGGDGTPRDSNPGWHFTRTFDRPGVVTFHDEITKVKGTLIVVPALRTIDPSFTGTWYDPAQSGHGLVLEVLPGNRFSATWLAFTPDGKQSWFTGVGVYNGNEAGVYPMILPKGGRWIPNFDASRITRWYWGMLSFSFTDCNHGQVHFDAMSDYGAGTMNLTRLTMPAGLTCE